MSVFVKGKWQVFLDDLRRLAQHYRAYDYIPRALTARHKNRMAELVEQMCENVLPSFRTYDATTCTLDVVPMCTGELEGVFTTPGAAFICAAFCTATVALCTGTDECSNPQTICPQILCKMGYSGFCAGNSPEQTHLPPTHR